jgi:predicted TIM-barrel fold metal-dependent hydrolase
MRLFLLLQNMCGLLTCLLGSLTLFFGTVVLAESRMPVIDMHLHAFEGDWTAENTPINPATKQPSAASTGGELMTATLAVMDRYNVTRGIVSGSLDAVRKWTETDPQRFIGSPLFPVRVGADNKTAWPNISVLKEEVRAGRIGALGEITTQYAGLPANTPRLDRYYKFAQEQRIPLAIHIAGSGAPGYPKLRLALGSPLLIDDVLIRYPNLRIYVMHAGFPFADEMIALMIHYPQLYVDLGWISWATPEATYYHFLSRLIDAEVGDRIMFGSDQAWWPEAIGIGIERIEKAKFLSEAQKRDILYNNAKRFLAVEYK